MARVDMHLRRQLAHLASPLGWVRKAVILSLSSVHSSSLVAVVHATIRTYEESRGKQLLAQERALRDEADAQAENQRRHAIPGLGKAVASDPDVAWAEGEEKAAAAAARRQALRESREAVPHFDRTRPDP